MRENPEGTGSLELLRRAFNGFVNPLDPVQILQKLAAPAAKVLWPSPLHARASALFAAVQVTAGHFEAVFRVQYDEFSACHVWNLPDGELPRNLYFRSGFRHRRWRFAPKFDVLAASIAPRKRCVNRVFVKKN